MDPNSSEAARGKSEGHEKSVTIVVDGREKVVTAKELTYAEVLGLVDNLVTGPNITYTITYRRGHGEKPEGTLVEGQTLKVKDGMIVNVETTDKS